MPETKFTPDDVAAHVRGTDATLSMLKKVFPESTAEELLDYAKCIAETPVAQLLLHQVLVLRKLPLG